MRDYQEEYLIAGDLEEMFHASKQERGLLSASIGYWFQALGCVPRYLMSRLIWRMVMLKNYLKIALRNLRKNRCHSLINIVGLSISLALVFLLIQIIQSYYLYDEFHENKDRIYRVVTHQNNISGEEEYASAPLTIAEKLSDECPGIERVVTLKNLRLGYASYQNLNLQMESLFCSPEFFDVFSYELTAGDPSTALKDPFSVVLTQEMAGRFFGTIDPIGKTIRWGDYGDFTVTGVLNDKQDYHSHIYLRPLVSWETLPALEKQGKIEPYNRWDHIRNHYVYFMLEEKVPVSQVISLLPRYASRYYRDKEHTISFHAQSVRDILPGHSLKNNLGSSMPMVVVYVTWGVAIIVIMTAGLNYTNLTIAKGLKRSREVGIRKVIGARRKQVFAQLIGEAVFLSLISLALALILYRTWLIPSFLNLDPIFREFFIIEENVKLILYFMGFAVITGITAGFLPALYISKFTPLESIKGFKNVRLLSRLTLRKTLLASQFTVSLVFMIMTVISLEQIQYIDRTDEGFQADSIVNIERRGVDDSLFRQRISQNASIVGISACDFLPGTSSNFYMPIRKDLASDSLIVNTLSVDEHFIGNMRMKMIAGKDFRSGSADLPSSIVVNASFAKRMGWPQAPDAVGKTIFYNNDTPVRIIGVVEDFSQSALDRSVRPCIIRFLPETWQKINVRLHPANMQQTILYLEGVWKELYPATPFNYAFYTDQMEENIAGMHILMKMIRFLAILTIIVSCMGLLGIAEYHSRTKVKEIGIRKVLGARVGQLIRLLSGEFVVVLLIAVIIAVPLSHLLNYFYLQMYERHVPIRLTYYLFGVGLILLFGMGSVLTQTIRASQGNPVDSLRYE